MVPIGRFARHNRSVLSNEWTDDQSRYTLSSAEAERRRDGDVSPRITCRIHNRHVACALLSALYRRCMVLPACVRLARQACVNIRLVIRLLPIFAQWGDQRNEKSASCLPSVAFKYFDPEYFTEDFQNASAVEISGLFRRHFVGSAVFPEQISQHSSRLLTRIVAQWWARISMMAFGRENLVYLKRLTHIVFSWKKACCSKRYLCGICWTIAHQSYSTKNRWQWHSQTKENDCNIFR